MTINKEGYRIIAVTFLFAAVVFGGLVSLALFAGMPCWILWPTGIVLLLFFLSVASFFREPRREHITDPDAVFSPADGKVVAIEQVEETEFLNTRCIQVSVFMSVANVHVNWYPVGGEVVYRRHHHGSYLVAWHPKSSEENERTTTVVDTGRERILFRQIAGMLARRIVNYAAEGAHVTQNSRVGFIKFGSRVDIFLPPDAEILVNIGDKVTGSRTRVARLKR